MSYQKQVIKISIFIRPKKCILSNANMKKTFLFVKAFFSPNQLKVCFSILLLQDQRN